MKELVKDRIKPGEAVAFELRRGQLLKVSDPKGQQVSDLICYNVGDADEWLCSGRTIDHSRSWLLTTGAILYSNRSNPMLSIVEDTCGRHDFIFAPCSQQMYQIFDDHEQAQHSCHENLYGCLMGWDIEPDEIYTPFSIFMHVEPKQDGSFSINPPASKAGDYVVFRAEMDLVIGLTACAAPHYNNGSLKPIDYEISNL